MKIIQWKDSISFATIEMEVIQPPQIIIKYPGNLIKPEMKVGVACISEGYPAPEVKLFKTGSPLDKSVFINDHEILIPSFMKEHEGEYKCIAQNTGGFRNCRFWPVSFFFLEN